MAKKVTKKSEAVDGTASVPTVDPVPTTATKKASKPRATSVPRSAKAAVAAAVAPQAEQTIEVTEMMIAECAYHMWRNGAPGDHHSHWLAAERELRNGR